MNIYFLRHGKTIAPGTYTGSTDVELSGDGQQQIKKLGPFLHKISFDICYCSPMTRCKTTFELLELDVKCLTKPDLKEIDFGSWEGKSYNQIIEEDSDGMKSWAAGGEDFQFPGGESIAQFKTRVISCIEAVKNSEFKNILIISHGGVIRYAISYLLELGTGSAQRFTINEGTLSLVGFEYSFGVLHFLNNRCY